MNSSPVVVEDYQGSVDPTILIPAIGSSFKGLTDFDSIVDHLENWRYKSALEAIDEMIQDDHQKMNALFLKGEILAHFDDNIGAIQAFSKILEIDPGNSAALVMILIQQTIINTPTKDRMQYLDRLEESCRPLYQKFKNVLAFIETNKMRNDFYDHKPVDLICVFGYFLNDDGSFPPTLIERSTIIKALADENPAATILISGGAVQNEYVEANEIKNHLIMLGIEESRMVSLVQARDTVGNVMEFVEYIQPRKVTGICVVTSKEHLSRCWMALKMGLDRIGYQTRLTALSPENKGNKASMSEQARLSYQTVFRAAGLFDKKDLDEFISSI
ncbi:ElyC/SanA/YdcF family protein [Marinilactibacillus sp. XAAS-LB27]|uniref:YdcF family protein n=1 Tax=Marinilactibacillus sp. XAAS-LB27 TaxID=3114538 RepID=UPI002E17109E|nr:ElyC/SanA/YdcF family protein [Marinilactibacillus sp. XAAS-LB27]